MRGLSDPLAWPAARRVRSFIEAIRDLARRGQCGFTNPTCPAGPEPRNLKLASNPARKLQVPSLVQHPPVMRLLCSGHLLKLEHAPW